METKIIYVITRKKLQKILRNKNISSGAKLVLLNLTSRLGGKNYCWPSQQTIANDLGLSDRQIRNHLSALKKHKIIKVTRRTAAMERGYWANSNEYNLESILHTKTIKIKPKK